MSIKSGMVIGALLLGVGCGISGNANAEKNYQQSITTQASYRTGAPELAQIENWLTRNAKFVNGVMLGEPANLGEVAVIYKASSGTGLQPAAVGDGPPVPLPASGNPGDEIGISSTSSGGVQSWSYRWVGGSGGGGWVLIRYSFESRTVPR